MTGTDILNMPAGASCPRVRARSASSKSASGSLHWSKYSRPCAVRVTRRVVRLRSDTPSFDSSTDNRRLTVEIGIPNERAARLMLSNWATLTNIRMLSRSAMAPPCHLWKADSRLSYLINSRDRADSSLHQKQEADMSTQQKTVIVTGASQGIGAAVANLFLDRGYNVVGNSRNISSRNELQRSDKLALVDGDIGLASTAEMIVGTAIKRFGSVDALVNNAGIFFAKPFTEYTPEDFRVLSSTNLDGFIYTTQLAVKQMLSQKSGGSVVSITTSIVDHPLAALTASVVMITKGGIDAISRSLAMEYAPQGIRVNVVAPGVVDTPLHKNNPKEFLRTLSPLGQISSGKDIAQAVFYLTEASQVTGEVLHVDGGAHLGRW